MDFPDTSEGTEEAERGHLAEVIAAHASAVEGLVGEAVRIWSVPPSPAALRGNPKCNPRWACGELAKAAGTDHLARFAEALGERSVGDWVETVKQWPDSATRVASWKVHFILRNHPDRWNLIRPDMTVREAQRLAGKPRQIRGVKHKVDRMREWTQSKPVWDEWMAREDLTRREQALLRQADEHRQAQERARAEGEKNPVAAGIWDLWAGHVKPAQNLETLKAVLESDVEQMSMSFSRRSCPKVLYPDLLRLGERFGDVGYDIVNLIRMLMATPEPKSDENAVETTGRIVGSRPELVPPEEDNPPKETDVA